LSYVSGKKHGHSVSYKDDGTIMSEGEYAEGMRQGKWLRNGVEVEYINDVEQ